MSNIYCVMFDGMPLSDIARDRLWEAGCTCIRKNLQKLKVVNDDVMGIVKTKFESIQFGGVAGIRFDAEISTPKGNSTVTYLVPEKQIEEETPQNLRWVKGRANRHDPTRN